MPRRRFLTAAISALAAFGLVAHLAGAQTQESPTCLKFGEETPEIYGPTDIGGTLASRRVSAAVNPEGTLSVLRWPSRSYYEQLKYMTIDRDLPHLGQQPNEGAFSGLALELRDGSSHTVWLRDLLSTQRYASDDSDTVLTRFRAPDLGLELELIDVAPVGIDALLRRHELSLSRESPVRRAELIAFANLNPTAAKLPLLPVEDWCAEERGSDLASYVAERDAIVYSSRELDPSVGEVRSVATAIGADAGSSGHQIGADGFTGLTVTGAPDSAFHDAADGRLAGNDRAGPAELDAAIAAPLAVGSPLTVSFAFGPTEAEALAELERARAVDALDASRVKRRSYLRWMREAPLPRDAPPAVTRLARRALVSLRQAIDTDAGPAGGLVAIVASLSTQAPYYVDWTRDGAFFNEVLDVIGHHDLVERHNRFYAVVQKKAHQGAPPATPLSTCFQPTPAGAWFMTNYADGGDAGTFPWEIDEVAYGLWTLWRHYEHLRGSPAGADYLTDVYPAIRRAGDLLLAFRDPDTKLPPGGACEDDNPPKRGQPTMHSAGPVLLAMRSAEAAAVERGEEGDALRYRARRVELEEAIDRHYGGGRGPWTRDFGDGGWALWPVRVEPYAGERSRAQGELVWERVAPAFEAPGGPRRRGQYEVKALHGLAHLYRETDPDKLSRVKRGLRWIAEVQAGWQGTGVLGEAWYVRDGEVASVVAQPHVWEQALFYLTSLRAYGRERFRAAGNVRPQAAGKRNDPRRR